MTNIFNCCSHIGLIAMDGALLAIPFMLMRTFRRSFQGVRKHRAALFAQHVVPCVPVFIFTCAFTIRSMVILAIHLRHNTKGLSIALESLFIHACSFLEIGQMNVITESSRQNNPTCRRQPSYFKEPYVIICLLPDSMQRIRVFLLR